MNPSLPLRAVLSLCFLLSIAVLAVADESATGSSRPAREPQAIPATLNPALVKPAAERAALVKPELRRAPMTKDQQTIFDIQELGRNQVLELQKQLMGLSDGPARRALEHKTIQVKRDTEVLMLRTISAQALQRGDIEGARVANEAIEMMLHPKAPAATLTTRPAPGDASNR